MRQTRALLWMTSEPWEPGRLRYGWAAGRRPYGRGFSVNSVLSVVQTRLTLCCLCFLGVQKAAAHGLLPRSRLPSGRCHRVTAAFSHACTSKLAVGSWQRSEVGGRRSEGRGDGARPGRSLLRRRGGPARYSGRRVSRGSRDGSGTGGRRDAAPTGGGSPWIPCSPWFSRGSRSAAAASSVFKRQRPRHRPPAGGPGVGGEDAEGCEERGQGIAHVDEEGALSGVVAGHVISSGHNTLVF